MNSIHTRFIGTELYFENLEAAKKFYVETLDLKITDEEPGHHVKFDFNGGFVCLEQKGVESYPSRDKAVLFFEVPDLKAAVAAIGAAIGNERIVRSEAAWAVLHDPEGHNVLLLQRPT
jgi:predicted enzyme related to lactoylglutathione lyase